jgi:hypothetical protein
LVRLAALSPDFGPSLAPQQREASMITTARQFETPEQHFGNHDALTFPLGFMRTASVGASVSHDETQGD